MFSKGLLRLLFSESLKKDPLIHYFNIGKIVSVLPKVKDRLYIEFVCGYPQCNNNNNNNKLKTYLDNNNEYDQVNQIFKKQILENNTIDDNSSILYKKELDDPISTSTIVKDNIERLKTLENLFFTYYHFLFNLNPQLDVTIIPSNFINNQSASSSSSSSPPNDHHPSTEHPNIDVLFIDRKDTEFVNLKEIHHLLNKQTSKFYHEIKSFEVVDEKFSYPDECYPQSMYSATVFLNQPSWVPPFKGVVLGGTYDRMHPGHKIMLTMSALLCLEYMEVGITDNSILTKKKYSEIIAPYQSRSDKTYQFLKSINPFVDYNMLKLLEPYANTKISKRLENIVISPETLSTAIHINEEV
eukprot:gene1996-2457_t